MKNNIIADIISGVILFILGLLAKYVCDKIKIRYNSWIQKKHYYQEIRFEEERYEQQEQVIWNNINSEITNLKQTFNMFKKDWSKHIPSSKNRLDLWRRYWQLRNNHHITPEQENTLLNMEDAIKELFQNIPQSQISKREKREYSKILQGEETV